MSGRPGVSGEKRGRAPELFLSAARRVSAQAVRLDFPFVAGVRGASWRLWLGLTGVYRPVAAVAAVGLAVVLAPQRIERGIEQGPGNGRLAQEFGAGAPRPGFVGLAVGLAAGGLSPLDEAAGGDELVQGAGDLAGGAAPLHGKPLPRK